MITFGSTNQHDKGRTRNISRILTIAAMLALFSSPSSMVWSQRSRNRDQDRRDIPRRPREYRTFDGTGNNVAQPLWGSAGVQLLRALPAAYTDGISMPAGETRLSSREISNLVCPQSESLPNARRLTDMVWQWGQFIDHDIGLTVSASPTESFPIEVPTGDTFFDPGSSGEEQISFSRSNYDPTTGLTSNNPRQQINSITAYLDASNVYGSDSITAASLREFSGGRMLTSAGDLLPTDGQGFFMAGDVRANEQTGLTSMHTLFVREHNRIAGQIARNADLDDEEIFQQTREQIITLIQKITFEEFLPALLGRNAIPPYRGYDPQVNVGIANCFSTAAYRLGHSMLNTQMLRLDNQKAVLPAGNLPLKEAFFNPSQISNFGIDCYLMGLCNQQAQEVDLMLVDDVRNFLFGQPGQGGFDLAALNIQRGRDHGLPDYNTFREELGLSRVESFADITSNTQLQFALSLAYETVDDIDAWVGFLAEDHVRGASVGPSIYVIMVSQFTALRDGDRFWHERMLIPRNRHQDKSNRLSDVIRRNTPLTNVQKDVFRMTNN